MYICILYRMCLDHCLHEPQGLSVLCSELGHSIVAGPAHGTEVPPANPKLAHLRGGGCPDRDLVNEAPHTLVQHLSPMCQVHPSLDLGLPRLVQGEPVHIEQDPKGPLSWYGMVLLGTVQYGQVPLDDGQVHQVMPDPLREETHNMEGPNLPEELQDSLGPSPDSLVPLLSWLELHPLTWWQGCLVEHRPWCRLAHVSDEQPQLVALDEPVRDVVVMGPVVVHKGVLLQGVLVGLVHKSYILHAY